MGGSSLLWSPGRRGPKELDGKPGEVSLEAKRSRRRVHLKN